MAIDRDKVMRALDIADSLPASVGISIAAHRYGSSGEAKTKTGIELLVHTHNKNRDAVLKILLARTTRIRRRRMTDDVWGECEIDGFKVDITRIGTCKLVTEEKEIEEPEMVPTGKTVKRTITTRHYECNGGDIVGKDKQANRDASQGGD